jgi:hypothetical protein
MYSGVKKDAVILGLDWSFLLYVDQIQYTR